MEELDRMYYVVALMTSLLYSTRDGDVFDVEAFQVNFVVLILTFDLKKFLTK